MNKKNTFESIATTALLVLASSCTVLGTDKDGVGASPGEDWNAPMGGSRTCHTMWETCHDNYWDCRDDCFFDIALGYSDSCLEACVDRGHCVTYDDRDADRCALYDYSFEPTSNPDVEAACERSLEADARCGVDLGTIVCSRWATVIAPEVAAWDDEKAKLPCDEDPPGQAYVLSTLGTEICASINNSCSYYICDEQWEWAVNQIGGLANDEVIAAARACADESLCPNITACLWSWMEVVWSAVGVGETPFATTTR